MSNVYSDAKSLCIHTNTNGWTNGRADGRTESERKRDTTHSTDIYRLYINARLLGSAERKSNFSFIQFIETFRSHSSNE